MVSTTPTEQPPYRSGKYGEQGLPSDRLNAYTVICSLSY